MCRISFKVKNAIFRYFFGTIVRFLYLQTLNKNNRPKTKVYGPLLCIFLVVFAIMLYDIRPLKTTETNAIANAQSNFFAFSSL